MKGNGLNRVAVLTLIVIVLGACNQNRVPSLSKSETKWLENVTTEFDAENQLIIDKKVCNYDLRVKIEPAIFNEAKDDVKGINYSIQFFNYGSEIQLCSKYIEDAFIDNYTGINYIRLLEKTDVITITEKNTSVKYGEWAKVKLTIENRVVNDVLMTPLSYKAYNNRKEDDLVFIQFYSKRNQKAMNVLLNADNMTSWIIKNHIDKIIMNPIISAEDGEGIFWFSTK